MKPTANHTPESWRQSYAALRRALQQRNEGLPSLPAGFNERMKARMAAEQAAAAPKKRHLWPWWSAAAAVAAIVAMILWPSPKGMEKELAEAEIQPDVENALPMQDVDNAQPRQDVENALPKQDVDNAQPRQDVDNAQPRQDVENAQPHRGETEVASHFNGWAQGDVEDRVPLGTRQENTSPVPTARVQLANELPTPKPAGRSPRLLALSVHTAGFGGGNSGTNPMAAQSDYYHTQKPSNYYFIAGNGYTFVNYAGVRAAQQSLNNYAVTINESHHDLPLTLGLSLNVPLSERWSLESGVTYTLLRSTFDYGNEQNYSHQLQRINYLGIPLQVQYALISSRAVRLYALAGLQVDFPLSIKQEWQQITNGRLTKEETTSPFALVPVQFSSIAGLGAQLNVTRHLSVFCEPSVQWFVPASEPVGGSRPQTWRTEHELAFSLPFGLRWTF